jgi:polar amino acid transport system substrate-binding protein
MWLKLLTCSLAAVLLHNPAAAQELRLVAAYWPPFTDQSLSNNGLATELVSTALSRAGYSSQYTEVPWARVLLGIQNDAYDVVVAAWATPEREVYGQFSAPYQNNDMVFLRKKGRLIDYQTLSDLYPYRIAVQRDASYGPAFDSDPKLQKSAVNTFESRARMLLINHADLTLEDQLAAQYQLNHNLRDIRDQLEFLSKPVITHESRILVRRSHPEHAQIIRGFDKAMAEMRADGTYAQIVQRHIATSAP